MESLPISLIDRKYVDSLVFLSRRLSKLNAPWTIGGDLGEALRTVRVNPDSVEIITSKSGAEQIFEAVKEYRPNEIVFQTEKLPRDAIVEGKTLPIYMQSHYFEFTVDSTKVKVYGDLQYRIDNWDWGDVLQFSPSPVYVMGEKVDAIPLLDKYDMYMKLGWVDRAEKVKKVLDRQKYRRFPQS